MREDLLPITWEGKLARLIEELGEVIKAYVVGMSRSTKCNTSFNRTQ